MELYREQSSDPTTNAQRNLMGRTHYVDPDTLRFHASRVLSARHFFDGLLFGIVTSDAINYEKTQRGFRFVFFDIFGTVVLRDPEKIEGEWFKSRDKAAKAMWAALNQLDAIDITLKAAERAQQQFAVEMVRLCAEVRKIERNRAAA